jgi:hypothetical protein
VRVRITLVLVGLACASTLPGADAREDKLRAMRSMIVSSLAGDADSVIAQVRQEDGSIFEVQVTPPRGQTVDPGIVRWAAGQEAQSAADEDTRPIDLSGYRIRINKVVAAAAASCDARFGLKTKPVNLGPDKGWVFESDSAIHMAVVAFPTKGDVDVGIFTGPDLVHCSSSFRKKQNLDDAGCVLPTCVNNGGTSKLSGIVGNLTTTQATYVGAYNLVFVTLP